MANTRPFTYNTGSTISGSNQIGNLAYGNLNDVNGGPDYSQNPGGKKWWMGPDENNRYIIGKDVPTMDHPTPVPEGDIGSVRFWGTDTESDVEFLYWINRLPGRAGLAPLSDPSTAYQWLQDSGYFTNYPASFSEFGTFYTYQGPSDNTPQALGVLYSPTQNKLFINSGPASVGVNYGNFVINSWTSTVDNTISGSNIYYSGSSYANQWLPAPTSSGGVFKRFRSGFMALDDSNDYLYVRSTNNGGIVKYDISNTPPTVISFSGNVPQGTTSKICIEPSSSYVVQTNGADTDNQNRAYVYDGNHSGLSFIDYLRYNTSQSPIKSTRFATPGPDGVILLTRERSTEYAIFNFTGNRKIYSKYEGNLDAKYRVERDSPQPIYVSSKNKWYVTYKRQRYVGNNDSITQGVDVVDGSTYSRTTYNFASETNNTGQKQLVHQPHFFLYDSDRDYFWTTSPVNSSIIAIDADDFSTQVSTTTSGNIVGQQQSAVLVDNKIIIVRPDEDNPIKVFDTDELIP